ncbi:MAG: hypothetical protein IJ489_10285 [Clostridia bacterium]|nr:hypothetical protein [Clostridia bacterium]
MDKKEYIERGALIAQTMKSRENSPYTAAESDLIHRVEHNKFISMVANQPTADVAPRAEVIDKFANRLKEAFDASVNRGDELFPLSYICDCIDEIRDEMEEAKDDG